VPTANALNLPAAESRLLNLIYLGRRTTDDGLTATAALADAEADVHDLLAVARDRLVRVHCRDLDVDLDAIEADPGLLSSFPIKVLPRRAGIRWVTDNPANSLLVYLAGTKTGQATLLDLKRHTNCEDAEENLLAWLRDDGLITVRDEAGRDIRRIRLHIAYSDRWLISITRAGRRRVGQN
jgi:hypothetical protein